MDMDLPLIIGWCQNRFQIVPALKNIDENTTFSWKNQPVEQALFRKGSISLDHLQKLKLRIEKSNEYNIQIHACVDFRKAFDFVQEFITLGTYCISWYKEEKNWFNNEGFF